MVRNRLRAGHLLPLDRGVYAVGHRHLRREGFWLAAVLAVGPGAVLSHRDAAALHGLRSSNRPRVDVTTTRRGRASQPRIDVHRTTALDPRDVTSVGGIPVTSVARTLVDLAAVVPTHHLANALSEAERQGVLDMRALDAALARIRTRQGKGHAALKAVLAEHRHHGPQLTRSELEDRFLALLAAHRIPRPRMNATIAGHEVDALWRAQRLVVELDGYAFHRHRAAFQRDRTKANALGAAGYTVMRYTYEDVVRRPSDIARELRPLLA